jgi:hypothetical protein
MAALRNRTHETLESPTTMYLEHLVQWLERGGKCHIFGVVMIGFR